MERIDKELDGILDKLSFSRLVDRVHATTARDLAMNKWVKSKADVRPWQDKLRKKVIELLGIDDILADGARRASETAGATMRDVRKLVGLGVSV